MCYRFSVEHMPYKNIEDRRASVRRAHAKLRQKLIDLKGGRCRKCRRNQTEAFLEIHHTAEDGKNHRRQKSRYRSYRWLLTHEGEYELLCRYPCHRSQTMSYVRSFRKGGSRHPIQQARRARAAHRLAHQEKSPAD